jgi:hypothetical protein
MGVRILFLVPVWLIWGGARIPDFNDDAEEHEEPGYRGSSVRRHPHDESAWHPEATRLFQVQLGTKRALRVWFPRRRRPVLVDKTGRPVGSCEDPSPGRNGQYGMRGENTIG